MKHPVETEREEIGKKGIECFGFLYVSQISYLLK